MSLKQGLFCSIQKVYSQLSSRRAYSLYKNAEGREQIAKAPSYNVVNVFLNREDVTPLLQNLLSLSAMPLKAVETDFAVDSSGFRTTCFGAYAEEKYSLQRVHKFIKAHAIIGVKTNVITGVEVLEGNSADSPQLPVLVERTVEGGFIAKEVSADKAYSGRSNIEAIHAVGGTPYIPFKSNASGKSRGSSLWRKAFFFFQLHADKFFQHYHKRSNVESVFGAVKKKFGETIKAKNPVAQKNELLCKLIAYNVTVLIQEMFELGIKPDFSAQEVGGGSQSSLMSRL
ncbi:transposase [Candidatus Micrarchaeota archaeon]|nr:transposase [Candidatus Micrarchaeota archaeon]